MQLKFRRVQPTKNRKGFVLPLIIIVVVFLTTHYARQKDADAVASSLQTVNKQNVGEEQIPVFELAPPFSTHQLPHLTPIDPSHLVPIRLILHTKMDIFTKDTSWYVVCC